MTFFKDKKIVGISDLRDESDKDGLTVVVELKRDAKPKAVLNNIYKHMETKVLTQEELQSLRNLRDQQNDILTGLGSLEYRITLLESNKSTLKSQIAELEKTSADLGAKFLSVVRTAPFTTPLLRFRLASLALPLYGHQPTSPFVGT